MSFTDSGETWPRMNPVAIRVANVQRAYGRGAITTGTLTGFLQTDAGAEITGSRVTASPTTGTWILDFPPLPLLDLRIWCVVFLGAEATPTVKLRRNYPVDDRTE